MPWIDEKAMEQFNNALLMLFVCVLAPLCDGLTNGNGIYS